MYKIETEFIKIITGCYKQKPAKSYLSSEMVPVAAGSLVSIDSSPWLSSPSLRLDERRFLSFSTTSCENEIEREYYMAARR